ncbi:Kelch repeat-containing protein [Kaarinaea lacus]
MKKVLTIVMVVLLAAACAKNEPEANKSSKQNLQSSAEPGGEKQWIKGWRQGNPLSFPRAGTAAVAHNGFIYVIGGVDGRDFVATVEYAPIEADGILGQWRLGPSLNVERGFIDAVVHNDSIYVVGGGNGPNGKNLLRSAERARINGDGSLSPWVVEHNEMKIPRRCSKIMVAGNHVYSFGGFGGALLDSVERAPILDNGQLGEWIVEDQPMTLPRYVNTVKKVQNNAYVIGGHDQTKGVGIVDVEWAIPAKQGSIGDWQKTSPLQVGRYGLSSAGYANYVYALGGLTGLEYLSSVEFAEVQDNGSLSAWQYTADLSEPRAMFSTVVHGNWIYIIGGTNQDRYLAAVELAMFDDTGQIGFWGTAQQAKAYSEKILSLKQQKTQLPNQGVVLHIQHASMYTYLNVDSNIGNIWLAGPKMDIQVNDRVQFSKGVSMSNFYSKELQQQFPVILFVSQIEKVQP